MNEEILKQILEELKKLNKHLDNIEAEKIGERIYTKKVAMAPVPEPYKSEEEQEKEEALKNYDIERYWEIINNPFSPNYQRNMAIKKLEELTGKKINKLTK